MKTREILRQARQKLSLSQDYVANFLGVTRTAVVQIESGNRRISSEELAKLCQLYGLSADYVLGRKPDIGKTEISVGCFAELPEEDQKEIMNLIAFKKQVALKRKS